jgi:hypothetical protein
MTDLQFATKGDASVTITEGDLLSLDANSTTILCEKSSLLVADQVTYADTGYAAAGTIELIDGGFPSFVASTEVTKFHSDIPTIIHGHY